MTKSTNSPRINITLNVDSDLKEEFISLKKIHGITFSDALEIGMKRIIHQTRSPAHILCRIDEKEIEILHLRNELRHANSTQKQSEADETDFRWDRDGKI